MYNRIKTLLYFPEARNLIHMLIDLELTSQSRLIIHWTHQTNYSHNCYTYPCLENAWLKRIIDKTTLYKKSLTIKKIYLFNLIKKQTSWFETERSRITPFESIGALERSVCPVVRQSSVVSVKHRAATKPSEKKFIKFEKINKKTATESEFVSDSSVFITSI